MYSRDSCDLKQTFELLSNHQTHVKDQVLIDRISVVHKNLILCAHGLIKRLELELNGR